MTAPLRVVLADDAVLFREALSGLLGEHGFDVVACVGDARELTTVLTSEGADVAIVDIRMPPNHRLDGLEAALEIRRSQPEVGLLLLSQYVETHHLSRLIGGNARGVGYLLKERVSAVAEFLDAVRRVALGGYAVDPVVVDALVRTVRRREPLAKLSGRERGVLSLVAQGHSNQGIAEALHLQEKTVETHVRNILTRLDLPPEPRQHRRVMAVLVYLQAHEQSTSNPQC